MESLWLLIFTTQSRINHVLRMDIIKQHGVAEARGTGPSGVQGYEAAPLSRCNRAIVDTLFPANLQLSSERGCHGNLLLPVAAAASPSLTKLCASNDCRLTENEGELLSTELDFVVVGWNRNSLTPLLFQLARHTVTRVEPGCRIMRCGICSGHLFESSVHIKRVYSFLYLLV